MTFTTYRNMFTEIAKMIRDTFPQAEEKDVLYITKYLFDAAIHEKISFVKIKDESGDQK